MYGYEVMRHKTVAPTHEVTDNFGRTELLLPAECVCASLQQFLVKLCQIERPVLVPFVRHDSVGQQSGNVGRSLPFFGDVVGNIPCNIFGLHPVRD